MNGPVEPSADMRAAAHELREMYVALIAEDFTDQQALVIVGQALVAAAAAGDSGAQS